MHNYNTYTNKIKRVDRFMHVLQQNMFQLRRKQPISASVSACDRAAIEPNSTVLFISIGDKEWGSRDGDELSITMMTNTSGLGSKDTNSQEQK